MFVLQKFIGSFIEFPGICITILILLRILLRKRFSRETKRNIVIGTVVFYLITTPFFAQFLIMPLESIDTSSAEIALEQDDDWNDGVIIVMGGSIRSPIPSIPGVRPDYESGSDTLLRLDTAYRLHKTTGMPIIVSGGNYDFYDSVAAATIMKDTLISWGIPSENVTEEVNARTSKENAYYSIELLPNSVQRIFLVTSANHMKRSVFSFKRATKKAFRSYTIIPIPCNYSYSNDIAVYNFFPGRETLYTLGLAIHEYIGFLFYFFTA
jgi:uncharacterized SAM-binding protein YcdF (DUF218 family)